MLYGQVLIAWGISKGGKNWVTDQLLVPFSPGNCNYDHPYFKNEETEVQRG